MHFDDDITPGVLAHRWKWRDRAQTPTLIEIHSTRSGIAGRTAAEEYTSTINWALSPGNRVDEPADPWGSIESFICGGGRVCRVLPDDKTCHYSLGHADALAYSIEIGQATEDTPFEQVDLDHAAELCADLCQRHGIPPIVLPYLSGDNGEAPGLVRHDRSANGDKWGKSDPGRLFNDASFEREVRYYMGGEDMLEPRFVRAAAIIRELAAYVEHGMEVPQELKARLAYIGVVVN